MKQKYTITVADMELNIISDASPDEVENIVGMLDRRMRDISLKSPRCTKNEAAVLCALAYCSERIAMQEAFKKVEKDAFRFAGENEKLKRTIEGMQVEMDNLRKDASVMRSILDRASIIPAPNTTEPAKVMPKAAPKAARAEEEEVAQLSAFDQIPEMPEQPTAQVPPVVTATAEAQAPAATATAAEQTAEAEATAAKKAPKGANNKKRLGTMFDILNFSDV